jgi:signal transduction histidine kinase
MGSEDGTPGASVGVVRDVTHERMLEQALRHAQKMEAVGTLASGVAHNLRNVLQAILGSVEVARVLTAAGQPAGQMLDRATTTTKKGAALIDQLMMFARKQEATVSLSPVHLDDAIRDAAVLIKPLLGNAIALEIDAGAPFGVVMADPMQLEQVFLNLAANARDAMPRGGVLTIKSTDTLLDEQRARAHGRSPGPHVIVTVTDTGVGMDAATKARVFEPFFTTKEIGKGTGLGLSTVFALVQQFGGCIEVESAPGAGTAFTICLPSLHGPLFEGVAAGADRRT